MALTPAQLRYWRNRTGNPRLTAGEAERIRGAIARGSQGSLIVDPNRTKGGFAGPTPAAAGPTPAAAGPAPPPDPFYDLEIARIGRRRDDTIAALDQQGRDVRREFGFDDTSDPFNRRAMLARSFEQRARGNTNVYAARGQLYSGALQNQQNETEFQRQRGEHDLRADYDRILGELDRRGTAARSAASDAELDALGGRIDRAAQNLPSAVAPLEAPATSLPAAGSPAGGLPPGYETWSLSRKRRYWARRRKERGQ